MVERVQVLEPSKIMLKAATVYPMGSGGNFLTRLLTLSEKTIPFVKHEATDIDQVAVTMSSEERFKLYNQFDAEDWRTSEYSVIMQYKWGQNDFYKYAESQQYLIDCWHPHVFVQEDAKQVLWVNNPWQHIVFIECTADDKQFLNAMRTKKDYPPNTSSMYQAQAQLLDTYRNKAIVLEFKTLLDSSKFFTWLNTVDHALELNLNMELSHKLWSNWFAASQQCWKSTSFNRQVIYGENWNPKIK